MGEFWLKIYPKKLLEWEWYDDVYMFRLFMHLLFTVNKRDKEWHGIDIKRGQLVTTLADLSAETKLTYQQVRTCLDKLTKTGEINRQTTNKFTIITICNYGKYQQSPAGEQQSNNNQTTIKQQSNNNQTTTTIEYKSERIKKKKISTKVDIKEKENDFVSVEFSEAFGAWLEYKRQRGEAYKTQSSLKACYTRLVKLAGGNPLAAMEIIEQSIANNYAGLFPLKNNNTYAHQQSNDRTAERQSLAAGYAERIAALAAEDDRRAADIRQP